MTNARREFRLVWTVLATITSTVLVAAATVAWALFGVLAFITRVPDEQPVPADTRARYRR